MFQPRPPLQYIRPTDHPIENRKTNPNIQGLAPYLHALNSYREEFEKGSEQNHLKIYEDAGNARHREMNELQEKVNLWSPETDENIQGSDPYRTIFVGRLPYEITEIELQKEFVRFGEIEKVRVVRNKSTNKSRGYGFILFKEEISARNAFREIGVHRGIEINGRPVIVDIERGRTVKYFKPRRLGGGLGGRGYMKRDKMAKFTNEDSRPPRSHPPRNSSPAYPRSRFGGFNPAKRPLPNQNSVTYKSRQDRSRRLDRSARPEY